MDMNDAIEIIDRTVALEAENAELRATIEHDNLWHVHRQGYVTVPASDYLTLIIERDKAILARLWTRWKALCALKCEGWHVVACEERRKEYEETKAEIGT